MFSVAIWPTKWRYDRLAADGNVYPVRFHRFANHVEMWIPRRGWVNMTGSDPLAGYSPDWRERNDLPER